MHLGWILWDWCAWLGSFLFELVVWFVIVCTVPPGVLKNVCQAFVFSELFGAILNHGAAQALGQQRCGAKLCKVWLVLGGCSGLLGSCVSA